MLCRVVSCRAVLVSIVSCCAVVYSNTLRRLVVLCCVVPSCTVLCCADVTSRSCSHCSPLREVLFTEQKFNIQCFGIH